MEDSINAKEFSSLLKMSMSTFNNNIRLGSIPVYDYKIAQVRMWYKQTVLSFLKQHYNEIREEQNQTLSYLKGCDIS